MRGHARPCGYAQRVPFYALLFPTNERFLYGSEQMVKASTKDSKVFRQASREIWAGGGKPQGRQWLSASSFECVWSKAIAKPDKS